MMILDCWNRSSVEAAWAVPEKTGRDPMPARVQNASIRLIFLNMGHLVSQAAAPKGLHHLEDIEFQIISFRHIVQDRVIRSLLPGFHLPEGNRRIPGGLMEHFHEQFAFHEMAAAAGGQVASPGQQLHGLQVDFLVSPEGAFHRVAAFGEGGRIQDDEIEGMLFLFLQFRQIFEHIGFHGLDLLSVSIEGEIFPGPLQGFPGDIHRCDAGSASFGRVQGKRTGVGEAVQHVFPGTDPGHRQPVVFLVQEIASLLAVHHVHPVFQAIFRDDGHQVFFRQGAAGDIRDALALRQAFQFPDLHIIPFVDAFYIFSHGPEQLQQQGEEHFLTLLHAQAQHLGHQHIVEPVHGEPWEPVRFPEDQPAVLEIVSRHDGFPVVQGILEPPFEEGLVELVIGVPGQETYPDLGMVVVEASADVFALLLADHIHQIPVFHRAGHVQHFIPEHPGMPAPGHFLPLAGDGHFCISTHALIRPPGCCRIVYCTIGYG